jgi:hypothetical protein
LAVCELRFLQRDAAAVNVRRGGPACGANAKPDEAAFFNMVSPALNPAGDAIFHQRKQWLTGSSTIRRRGIVRRLDQIDGTEFIQS